VGKRTKSSHHNPIFQGKGKTTCTFKKKPETRDNIKDFTSKKVRKDGMRMHCPYCGGEGYNKTICNQMPAKLKVNKQSY